MVRPKPDHAAGLAPPPMYNILVFLKECIILCLGLTFPLDKVERSWLINENKAHIPGR